MSVGIFSSLLIATKYADRSRRLLGLIRRVVAILLGLPDDLKDKLETPVTWQEWVLSDNVPRRQQILSKFLEKIFVRGKCHFSQKLLI